MEAKLQKETEVLKKQLSAAQEMRKSGNVAVSSHDDANRNQYMLPVIPKDENSDGEMDINVSMIPREEGEVKYVVIIAIFTGRLKAPKAVYFDAE